jgi:hypothetical protein
MAMAKRPRASRLSIRCLGSGCQRFAGWASDKVGIKPNTCSTELRSRDEIDGLYLLLLLCERDAVLPPLLSVPSTAPRDLGVCWSRKQLVRGRQHNPPERTEVQALQRIALGCARNRQGRLPSFADDLEQIIDYECSLR